LTFRFVEGEGF